MSLLSIALLMLGQSATASEPLKPSAQWVVDYAESMCTLGREFGPGAVTFGIRPSGLSTGGGLAIAMIPGAQAIRNHRTPATFVLDDGSAIEVDANVYWLPEKKMRVVTAGLDAEAMAKVMSGRPFGFPTNRREHIWFEPEGVASALKVLKNCEDDLLVSFGVPANELAQIVEGPRGDVSRYFGSAAYPSNALFVGKGGQTSALLEINALGNVTDCRITANSGHEAFRKSTCDSLMRAQFEPAKNAAGEPVRSWYPVRVTWQVD
ncbi:energy transducer TonB [Sphingomonas sp. AX6]|uniref:energy transducer TonB n=1 Tax=Sphingomonas sp. AX6 TaxID=2653171 RepID=UPI0012F2C22D|nr:energy transducer TonB [Sphingomonas sp. AX6]VXC83911.1 conserved exported hypothetical protein [Sphingomonas sp. AX6]